MTKVLATILIALLLLDGVLTFVGIEVMRLSEEGNPFMRHAMSMFGVVPTLVVSRIAAIACLFGIIRGVDETRSMLLLTMLILVVFTISIVPWVSLLLEYSHA